MPPVLTERVTWKKSRLPNETRRADDLTPEEYAHVRAALRFLRARLGGYRQLAQALRVKPSLVMQVCSPRGRRPGAVLAIRAARVADVPIENVLRGLYPPAGSCPMCGRCDVPPRDD